MGLAKLAALLFFKWFKAGTGGNLNVPGASSFSGDVTMTGGANALTVGEVTTADATAVMIVATNTATRTPLVIQAAPSQSANLIEFQDSDGNVDCFIAAAAGSMRLNTSLNVGGSNGTISLNHYTAGIQLGSARPLSWASSDDASVSKDSGLAREAAGVVRATNGSTGRCFFQTLGDLFRATTQAVDSTTLTADNTLSVSLAAGRKYRFRLVYFINVGDTAADGFKLDFNGGTATATTFIAQTAAQDAGATAFLAGTNPRVTALDTAFSCTSTTNFIVIAEGAIVVNGAGTFIPKFAKVADAGTGITAQIGSTLTVWDCA